MEDCMEVNDIIHSYENEIDHFRMKLQFIDSFFYKLMFITFSITSIISVTYKVGDNFITKEMFLWIIILLVFLFFAFSICLIYNRNVIIRYLIKLEKKYNELVKDTIKSFDSDVNLHYINDPLSKYMFFIYCVILGILFVSIIEFKDFFMQNINKDFYIILILFGILIIGVVALIIDNPYRNMKKNA
jgi:hypothetical protein